MRLVMPLILVRVRSILEFCNSRVPTRRREAVKHVIGAALVVLVLAVATSYPCAAGQTTGVTPPIHRLPTPRPTPRPTPLPTLPAPFAPHYTTNPDECVHHGDGPSQCSWLNWGKAIDVYWSWKCRGKHCAIGGYNLRLAGSDSVKYGKVVGISTGRFIVQDAPKGGWKGACYVVTAYPLSPHAAAESKPSPKICIRETQKTLIVKTHALRGYTRIYSYLYSDGSHTVQTYTPSEYNWANVGATYNTGHGQSQTNTFLRAGFAFDLSSVGGNSIFGATFAYDANHSGIGGKKFVCGYLTEAPDGWKTASWITPSRWYLPGKATKSGSTVSQPIDKLVESWNRAKPLALFLWEGSASVGDAAQVKDDVVPDSFTCYDVISNPRLILKVGITV